MYVNVYTYYRHICIYMCVYKMGPYEWVFHLYFNVYSLEKIPSRLNHL